MGRSEEEGYLKNGVYQMVIKGSGLKVGIGKEEV